MKTNHFFKLAAIALTATLVLTSCSQDENLEPADGNIPVLFSNNIAAPETRTTAAGDSWSAEDQIGIYMMSNTESIASALNANIAYKAATAAATTGFTPVNTDETIYYPQSGTVDFIAYYPYKATGTSAGEINNHLYPVNTADQTNPAAIDLLYSDNVMGKARSKTDPAALEFTHALSKLTFNVIKGKGMTAADFSDMTVTVSKLNTTTTFDLGTADFGTLGDPADITARVADAGVKYDAIVVPQTSDAATKVTFTVNGASYVWTMGAQTFTGGNEYVFDVTVNETAVGATGTIKPWTTGTPVPGEAESLLRAITITNNGNGTAIAEADGVEVTTVMIGTEITITATPASIDYVLKQWVAVSGSLPTFTTGSATTSTATFTMPGNAVEIHAEFDLTQEAKKAAANTEAAKITGFTAGTNTTNTLVFNPTISEALAAGATVNLVEVKTGTDAASAVALAGSSITNGVLSLNTQNTVDAAQLDYVGATFTVTLNGVTSDPVTLDISALFGADTTTGKLRTDKAKLSGFLLINYSNADANRDVNIGKTMSPGVAMTQIRENGFGSINNTTLRADAGGNILFHFGSVYTGSSDICMFSNIPLTCGGTTYTALTEDNAQWEIAVNS